MLCTNGHNNAPDARFCTACGVNTFHPDQVAPSSSPPAPSAYMPAFGQAPPSAYTTTPGAPYGGIQAPYLAPWNGFAITSLVLGIVWIYWIGSLLAVIFGVIALRQITERRERGRGMAIAGVVLGSLFLIVLVVVIIVVATHVHKVVTN